MSDYFNVTTNVGDVAIATAIANNSKLNITHIAFGDGNGSVPTPTKTRTSLVREVHRQAVTKYAIHPTIANYIVIETIIPSNIGGFWIREMGIIADNILISHGSHAPFFKVADPDGVSEYRLKFTQNVRDGNVVEISLDESLIYASQAWVNENYIRRNELVDNLTTDDAKKPVSAKQAKNLQDNKLDKTANAASATKLNQSRKIGGVSFDATKDINLPGVNIQGNQNTSGVVLTWLDNGFSNSDISIDPEAAWNDGGRVTAKFTNSNNALAINVSGILNERKVMIQSGHDTPAYAYATGELQLNPLGGPVTANGSKVITVSEGIAVSATRLQNPRTVFGQTFDGSGDVGGTVTASTGLVQADSFHYIDMGRTGLDRMNFYNYGAIFNFIDSEYGNVVARITQNGIDCNAASASKLQTARTVSFSGAATGSFNFDGSGNSSAVLTLANSGVAASTYGSNLKIPVVTVNAKGLITSVSEQAIPEVVDATESTSGKAQLATLAETLAGTNTTKIVTPYNLAQTVFGMNQTNKLKTVVSGTTYTHSNDKPSFLSISMNGSSGAWAIVRHNGNTLLDTNSSGRYAVSILVAKGDTYYISGTSIVCMEFS
ncbi:phage tail protein [Acinetobacter johnsonii]|uniref:phage tail protein n=1 Tax=Acinetobacter johnsonii TaxID=40214 RepID=UPI002447B26C|nr:phage tail protein [Acinetobacter johnsonii]MDH0711963.1 phage tail protein [Acinetobacter johnsonii]